MKTGQRVIIYEDPITKRHKEGEAVLKKKWRSGNGDGYEYWFVRFDSGHIVPRTIDTNNVEIIK